MLAQPSMVAHPRRHSSQAPPGRLASRLFASCLSALALAACGDGSIGHAPVARCHPSPEACPPAMFQGGLRAELGTPSAGARVYADNCARCHGPDGRGLADARHIDMTSAAWQASLRDSGIIATVRAGRGPKMPAFDLDDGPLRDLLAHIRSLATSPPSSGGSR